MNKEEFNIVLGKTISEIRKKKKISQETLGQELSLTRYSIVNIEKGKQQINVYQLWKIAEILNVKIEAFFEGITQSGGNIVTFGHSFNKSTLDSLKDFLDKEH
ncbi:helix-turn-helix transcriptional regulator [Leadbetterella byssophila]|uniref:helix-turn-helix transcriptional regulator n=1 Tax=Leadbetterella byssophila TaxID=316068 RepID=UPI00399F595A